MTYELQINFTSGQSIMLIVGSQQKAELLNAFLYKKPIEMFDIYINMNRVEFIKSYKYEKREATL